MLNIYQWCYSRSQLPAGLAEKTNWCCIILCMYILKRRKFNRAAVRQGSAAVRTVGKDRGVQQWGRWYSQAPVGGRYFRNKKKVHLPQDEKRLPRTERPTHLPTTNDAVHPTLSHRPNLYYTQQNSSAAASTSEQQCSSTYSSTPGTRGAVSWLVLEDLV